MEDLHWLRQCDLQEDEMVRAMKPLEARNNLLVDYPERVRGQSV